MRHAFLLLPMPILGDGPGPEWLAGSGLGLALGLALGAAFGSFLATMLVRWPRGEGVARGRSHCDGCGRALAWWEVVPLLSFPLARGRCRTCSAAIDPAHALLEYACAAIGAAAFVAGLPWLAPFGWLLAILAAFDARHLWLPDPLVAALAAAALLAPAPDAPGLAERLIGGAAGFAVLYAVAALYARRRGRQGLGGGDAKLLGAIGLWCGGLALPGVLLAGCAIGLAHAALRRAGGEAWAAMRLPLGTYLCLAAPLTAIMPT